MTFDSVLLLAFGGPEKPEEVRPFLEIVTAGRRVPPERLEAVAHHYELIGGRSPLTELTLRQEGLGTVENRDAHGTGWNSALNKLAGHLAAGDPSHG